MTGIGFTLPMCIMDEILAFLDSIMRDCYVGWIIPTCMVAGDTCPTDPNAFIDVINCQIVGVSDGIQNLLFLGYTAFGQWFVNFAVFMTSSTLGLLIPGLNNYMNLTLNGFKLASDAQLCREWWCFGFTAPVIALPLMIIVLSTIFISILIPALLATGVTAYVAVEASPAGSALPGNDSDEFNDDGEFDQEYTTIPSTKDGNGMSVEAIQRYIRFQSRRI